MMQALGDMSRPAMIRAVETNLTEFHVFLSGWPEITLHRDSDRVWTMSRRRFSLCNVLLEAHFDSADIDDQIDRALTPYLKYPTWGGPKHFYELGLQARHQLLGRRLRSPLGQGRPGDVRTVERGDLRQGGLAARGR